MNKPLEELFTARVEFTDTFGGEANYSWVKRASFEAKGMTDVQIKRKAKAELGLSGIAGKWQSYGEMHEFRPYRSCTVLFVTFDY